MHWQDLERHASFPRIARYLQARDGDPLKATSDYTSNILLAEALFPMLNVLEIGLRNGIQERLCKLYGRRDWWQAWVDDPLFSWQRREIESAITKLLRRGEPHTPDKILAELSFGFWSSLFNSQFQSTLWKDLRLVFTRCPKPKRQRHTISAALNQIRNLRNRAFHHEPLLWLDPALIEQHAVGLEVISWIDPRLGDWLGNHDRLPAIWVTWQANH